MRTDHSRTWRPRVGGGLALLLATGARPAAAVVDWQDGCRPFIAPAERFYRLPAGLLAAMAQVESGHGGRPYPWALNIAGQPLFAADYAGAALRLRDSAGRPRRDVAVGCLQLHMHYHLGPFQAPEWALHPRYNVWYAALFLRQLHDRYGLWSSAVAQYHASDRAAQQVYLCQVAHHWRPAAVTAWCGPAAALPPIVNRAGPQSGPSGPIDRR